MVEQAERGGPGPDSWAQLVIVWPNTPSGSYIGKHPGAHTVHLYNRGWLKVERRQTGAREPFSASPCLGQIFCLLLFYFLWTLSIETWFLSEWNNTLNSHQKHWCQIYVKKWRNVFLLTWHLQCYSGGKMSHIFKSGLRWDSPENLYQARLLVKCETHFFHLKTEYEGVLTIKYESGSGGYQNNY